MWVELNTRINYPIKRNLIQTMENSEFYLDDRLHFCCVSSLTRRVADVGLKLYEKYMWIMAMIGLMLLAPSHKSVLLTTIKGVMFLL